MCESQCFEAPTGSQPHFKISSCNGVETTLLVLEMIFSLDFSHVFSPDFYERLRPRIFRRVREGPLEGRRVFFQSLFESCVLWALRFQYTNYSPFAASIATRLSCHHVSAVNNADLILTAHTL